MRIKVCAMCGKSIPKELHGKYCSEECRTQSRKKRQEQEPVLVSLKCEFCNADFLAPHNSRKKYCSEECRKEAHGIRAKKKRGTYNASKTKICRCCGKPFESTTPNNTLCSEECRRRIRKQQAKEYGKRRYTLKNGETYEQYMRRVTKERLSSGVVTYRMSPEEIYERYGYVQKGKTKDKKEEACLGVIDDNESLSELDGTIDQSIGYRGDIGISLRGI